MKPATRNLVLVLGDQLDERSSAFDGFDAQTDAVWMAEVDEESTHIWSHQARIAMFLAAMRHFRETLRIRGIRVFYRQLDDRENQHTFSGELAAIIARLRPEKLIVVQPGEWRVEQSLRQTARTAGVELEIRPDRHFLCSREEFAAHAATRRQLRMEFFYREMRRKHRVLMQGDEPVGGAWNFDAENRRNFGKDGAPEICPPRAFPPDALTREVLALVARRFAKHPGRLDYFDWPVSRAQAQAALADFIEHRLPQFGTYQDAMWTSAGELANQVRRDAFLFHSRLSAALNLKLLDPREVIAAAEAAYRSGRAPLASVEGFIRQILGWREYVRGVYWEFMPAYAQRNVLDARVDLPAFYWTGATDMNCLRVVIGQTLEFGYAHHIQRLMVTGLFALLLGVKPQAVHEWYLAVYVDAIEWVELPNVLGMSQYADGGVMASKPYVATGKYIQRMSNYCAGCRYDPAQATGERACPFTTLYWDFLLRHEKLLARNQRMTMQMKNLVRLSAEQRDTIRRLADKLRASLCGLTGRR
ncbi:MAG TPA: cryptochrome/photolyase family protein [Verrucomicrobiae bacterium]